MTNRWVMNRVGLLNFWYYAKETFELAEGKMLLRGTNGSGKSLTMQSLFPVLFDGDTSAYRLDSFGSRDRKMEDYLLGEKGVSDRDEGIGYLFLEVKRQTREEYLTVGIGMHANRGGNLTKWFFAIENNQRIGHDLELYEEITKGTFTPLTKKKLKNRLEGVGRVFETQRDYKSFVNQRIFGFDSLDQFDELITLLLQLRSPKLSKDFRPSVIYGILRNSLPKLKDDELLTLSKTIEQLDLHRERLEDLNNEIKELTRFAKNYQRWHEELVAQVAGKWRQLAADQRQLARIVENFKTQLQQNNELLLENQQTHNANELQLAALDTAITQLRQHEGMNLVSEGIELEQRLQKNSENLKRTKIALMKKTQMLQNQQMELSKCENLQAEFLAEIDDFIEDNQQYLAYLRFQELDSVYSEKLRQTLTNEERRYWLEQVRQKESHLRKVREMLVEVGRLQKQLKSLEKILGDLQQEFDELERDLRQWQQTRESELEKWKTAIDQWREGAPFQLTADEYQALLYRLDSLLEAEEREELVLQPVSLAYQRAVKEQQLTLVPLENQRQENTQQMDLLEKEIKEWQAQKTPEPRRFQTRSRNRESWPQKAEYVLFYQAVDFQPEVTGTQQSQIEGALLAAGILDGVISCTELRLADDTLIRPNPQMFASTLAKVLTVNPDLSPQLKEQVANVLDSIYYDETEMLADLPVIESTGNYRIANLTGAMPLDYQASFIGAASQERYRQEQIVRLQAEIQQLETENVKLAHQIAAIQQHVQAIEDAYQAFPPGTEVYQTYEETKNLVLALAAKTKEINGRTTECQQLRQHSGVLKNQLVKQTAADHLKLEVETYDDALRYAENYKQNLQDAFTIATERKQQIELSATLSRHIQNFQEEEADLLAQVNDLSGSQALLERRIAENEKQQKIVNVAELTAQLKQATEEQGTRQQQQKTLNTERIQLEKTVTKIAVDLEHEATQLSLLSKQEYYWRRLLENELQRFGLGTENLKEFAKRQGKDLNIKELKKLEDQVASRFNFLADQLQNYQPKLVSLSGVDLPPELEQALGEFASFNNFNEPRFLAEGQTTTTGELLERLQEQQLTLRELLKKDDEQLFKKIILESVGKILRVRIQQAQQWVLQMNELLKEQKNSSGLSLSISWKGIPAASNQDLSTNQLVTLLQKPTELLAEADREAVSRHFQEKVHLAQEQLQNNPDDRSTLFQAIAKVLDYRDWFEFELKYKRANEGYQAQPLTDRRFNQFSGGEKAIAMYLPLFAATYSRYEDAGQQCPRVITLDEAFAGIDDQNIAELFKACEQLGFNYVMNSQALFGDYPTVSKLAIYELLRPQNVNFVTTIRYYWDGQKKHLLTGADEFV